MNLVQKSSASQYQTQVYRSNWILIKKNDVLHCPLLLLSHTTAFKVFCIKPQWKEFIYFSSKQYNSLWVLHCAFQKPHFQFFYRTIFKHIHYFRVARVQIYQRWGQMYRSDSTMFVFFRSVWKWLEFRSATSTKKKKQTNKKKVLSSTKLPQTCQHNLPSISPNGGTEFCNFQLFHVHFIKKNRLLLCLTKRLGHNCCFCCCCAFMPQVVVFVHLLSYFIILRWSSWAVCSCVYCFLLLSSHIQ